MKSFKIETNRLILRELTQEDAIVWHKILSDEEGMKYYPKAFDMEKTISWIEWNLDNYSRYGFGLWAVILKETNQFIGDCGITMQNIYGDDKLYPEIGYHLDKQYWRKGYSSEAGKACLQYAFENFDFGEVFAYQKWTNIPSRKVAEKIGMSFRIEYEDEKNEKTSVYSIKREEWEK